jgi:hypothetical protein
LDLNRYVEILNYLGWIGVFGEREELDKLHRLQMEQHLGMISNVHVFTQVWYRTSMYKTRMKFGLTDRCREMIKEFRTLIREKHLNFQYIAGNEIYTSELEENVLLTNCP